MQKQLHPGAKWLFRLNSYFSLLILLIVAWIFIFNRIGGTYFSISTALSIILLVIIFGEIYARLSYHFWMYEFTTDNLKIERGIIWKRYSNIPYARVQNVDVQRGVIARLLGFSSVNIQTAGYSAPMNNSSNLNAEGYIPAIDFNEAEKIREFVLKKISKRGKSGL